MKIVAALTDPAHASLAEKQGADILELRFDLMEGDPLENVQTCRDCSSLPIVATIRSAREGGRFFGNAGEWFERIKPVVPLVDYVDVEQQFSSFAPQIKESGSLIISSHHEGRMLTLPELFLRERELREFGDIVKIIVTPANEEDIIELISFTHAIKKPLCTGVMGAKFRCARAILPLFGSQLAYCNVGAATAAGQYSVEEFISLIKLLTREP
jgi:3-dehydroquinate dehydratase-1